MASLFARFARERKGVAAIETAILLPVVAVLALSGFDLARYAIYARKVQLASATAAELVARNDSGKISQSDMEAFYYAQLLMFPEAMEDAEASGGSVLTTLSSTLSGVSFVKSSASCTANCAYKGYVAWTGGSGRPCGTPMQSVSNTAQPSSTTLPEASFGPNFLIVADLSFQYKPIFLKSIVKSVTISRSTYVAPRYVTTIAYSSSGGSSMSRACTVPSS